MMKIKKITAPTTPPRNEHDDNVTDDEEDHEDEQEEDQEEDEQEEEEQEEEGDEQEEGEEQEEDGDDQEQEGVEEEEEDEQEKEEEGDEQENKEPPEKKAAKEPKDKKSDKKNIVIARKKPVRAALTAEEKAERLAKKRLQSRQSAKQYRAKKKWYVSELREVRNKLIDHCTRYSTQFALLKTVLASHSVPYDEQLFIELERENKDIMDVVSEQQQVENETELNKQRFQKKQEEQQQQQ
jgi:hypothetical protein